MTCAAVEIAENRPEPDRRDDDAPTTGTPYRPLPADVAAELVERMDRDQQARSPIPRRALDDTFWAWAREVDADNTAWLRQVIDRYGWPRRSDVGPEAATAAWLLTQHADHDPDFQRRCLALLGQAVRDGEAKPAHLAYLTDRVLRAEGRPQRYGTQFWYGPDGTGPLQPQPIEDPEHVDERRHSLGLDTLAEYAARLRQRESEHQPPTDP
ncbi:DUF6624 domain-containing protein [Micromonospora maris]|uniref:DUF6624 domain-containing protein n=1 Tax=Micromonospora maris TaxID=1003110 RepID=UPI002E0EC8E6|nr:hypothetical protein OG712_15870 [Micromonospora maris]